MRIRDLKPAGAVTVGPEYSLRDASKHLADDDIGVVVVVDARGIAGIFGERDLARAVADGIDLDDEQVAQYMTQAPLAVGLDAALSEAIGKMNGYGVRHLVVTDGRDLVGVVSMRDVIGLLGTNWPEL